MSDLVINYFHEIWAYVQMLLNIYGYNPIKIT